MVDNDEVKQKERAEKLEKLEIRIGRTDSGEAFLARVREIGRPSPLRDLPSQQGE